jgi:DNA-binding response OmpR family regulator
MAPNTAGPCMSRPDVLLLEDDLLHGALVQMVLEASEIEVHRASAASEAARTAKEQLPDLVLVSWGAEGIDGRALLAFLRLSVPGLARVPAVLMTDRDLSAGLRSILAREGYTWILQKPIVPTGLPKLVRRTIAEQNAKQSAAKATPTDLSRFIGCGTTASTCYMESVA